MLLPPDGQVSLAPSTGKLVPAAQATALTVDAGVAHVRLRTLGAANHVLADLLLESNRDFATLFAEQRVREMFGDGERAPIFITGKLAPMVRRALGCGRVFLPAGVLWLAASEAVRSRPDGQPLALIEISASGYTVIGVDAVGALKDDLLVANPRCGAGSGINVDRVLQKLGLARGEVDRLLADYLGESGRELRRAVPTRADRCGVFSSSATISDKNQGIPLPVALATTLKSELLKACSKLPAGYGRVLLCGRFFRWQFVRECAEDHLAAFGVREVEYDTENTRALDTLARLVTGVSPERLSQPDPGMLAEVPLQTYPAFAELHARYLADHRYTRHVSLPPDRAQLAALAFAPVHVGLDVGSTMAKIAVCDVTGRPLYLASCSNAGDTIETVKTMFCELQAAGVPRLAVLRIGITGSARYQVKEALAHRYPGLAGRIDVLVENYAHARGSIEEARRHLLALRQLGVDGVNEDFCVLVDVGGEDTKVSTIALREAELFNNAMNIKCSAGTGSLLDTLSALFGVAGPAEASRLGYAAPRGFAINATCAVFLMENAQKLQAQGVPRDEILASASWAIVENMARTLWSQVDLPGRCVVLLHGQTMLSDPLPLAITHRLQSFLGGPVYALVPSHPGHRACFGLVQAAMQAGADRPETLELAHFIDSRFEKRLIQCKGAACDDAHAVCNRTSMKCLGADGRQFSFTLGGCSAINELFAKSRARRGGGPERAAGDTYKALWDFFDGRQPRSSDPRRLVIPRSFTVSEWSYFLSQIFVGLGVPVHVDALQEGDLTTGQALLDIDTCAPHIGAVGQLRRLAGEPHGIILAPQIEQVCTDGMTIGRTCTTNQGGMAVGAALARAAVPGARIELVNLSLERQDPGFLADQLFDRLAPVFRYYNLAAGRRALETSIARAWAGHGELRDALADQAAQLIEQALDEQRPVALVVGREYVLNPGIYDSHVRRLLRDKGMAAIPSYVLDVELDPAYGRLYWRNPHLIVTVLDAVARKALHRRLRHPRLREAFRRIETGDALLPVVQISTFSCGPDSVISHLVAEIMKRRPFLLIQSDAIIKELAHLENRVSTHVRQLELGLHARLKLGGTAAFDVRVLDGLDNRERLNPDTDAIYCPTAWDNRFVTSVLRAAGYTCVDNYAEGDDLTGRVRRGRALTGDAVCAPLAAVYADLQDAVHDFAQRCAHDPAFRTKRRLLFIDNTGSGPCRQGQYVNVHKLLAHRHLGEACGGGRLSFLVADEAHGYDFGLEEWALLRSYLGVIVQGVLQQSLFSAAAECRDRTEYEELMADYRCMKNEIFAALERFHGPGSIGRRVIALVEAVPVLGLLAKYFLYRLHGSDLRAPLGRFAARWQRPARDDGRLAIHVSGEIYMRVAQGEAIFRALVAQLGFRRFRMRLSPLWVYLEYLIEYEADQVGERLGLSRARAARDGDAYGSRAVRRAEGRRIRRFRMLRWMLRNLLARPLYRAAGLAMPEPVAEDLAAAREVVPTLRPVGEFPSLAGEALRALRAGTDVFLIVGPRGCMVASMTAALSSEIERACRSAEGTVQHLFSADGEVDETLLALALLRSLGPRNFFLRARD